MALEGALSSFWSVFRDLVSTKQKTPWIGLQLLQNPVQRDCRAASFAHEIAEFLKTFPGLAGQSVHVIPERDFELARQRLEGLGAFLHVGNGLANIFLFLVQHGGELLDIGHRRVDRLFVLGRAARSAWK